MSERVVTVVRTGVANMASVAAAFARAGVSLVDATGAASVRDARAVVLPGVGTFGAACESLRDQGVDRAIRDRIEAGAPTLAICLGMQLLAPESDESPGARGLGIIREPVTRFSSGAPRIPQMGWNDVNPAGTGTLIEPGVAYYANSFKFDSVDSSWSCAWSTHGTPFVASIERGAVLACQFHPELSGRWGATLLDRWLAKAGV